MSQRIRPWADLITVALLVWMGIHTIRTCLAVSGRVLGAGLTPLLQGVLLLTIWGIGLLGYPVSRMVGGRSPSFRLGVLFGLLYVLYRAVPGPFTGPLFGSLSVTAWLWVLTASLHGIALRGAGGRILPGMIIGLAGQVSLQTALHGLDLVQLQGPGPGALALVLAALLAVSLRLGSTGPVDVPVQAGLNSARREATDPVASRWGEAGRGAASRETPHPGTPGWGLIAWGPYLALQMTLASNLGWVAWLSSLSLQGTAALILTGLALGVALSSLRAPYALRLLAGMAGVALLAWPERLSGAGIWKLAAAQALLPVAMMPAFGPHPGRPDERVDRWVGLGSVAGIALLLLFYLRNEWKALWSVMAALAALPGLWIGARQRPRAGLGGAGLATTRQPRGPGGGLGGSLRPAAAVLVLGLVAIPLSLIPRSPDRPATGPAPAELTVMTFNIHHLISWRGVPAPEEVARAIEEAGADLIGLQETDRGWNLTGGADLVAWLRWRFPGYHVIYGKTEGDLVGNILLSRYPILESGWKLYQMQSSQLQRGLVWARIPTVRGDLLVVNTHLSAWRTEEPERLHQVEQLLAFWDRFPRFILLGDLNARPGSEPLRRLEQAGLVNLPGALGMGETPTFPAGQPRIRLDHVFGSAQVKPVRAEIPETYASDHRPLVVQIRLE